MKHNDVRVRLHAAVSVGVLFDTACNPVGDEQYEIDAFEAAVRKVTVDPTMFERCFSSFVVLANAAICAPRARVPALASLVLATCRETMYNEVVRRLLCAVADRLGFDRAALLFESFSLEVLAALHAQDVGILQLDWRVLGYGSEQEGVNSNLEMISVVLLAQVDSIGEREQEQLAKLCEVANVTHDEFLLRTIPLFFAVALGDWLTVAREEGTNRTVAWNQAVEFVRAVEKAAPGEEGRIDVESKRP